MAKIYTPPRVVGPPPEWDFSDSYEEDQRKEKEWTDKLAAWCRTQNSGEFVGEIIREPVADGYAEYMVLSMKPLKLIHLPTGDAYQSRWAHRWTAGDVKKMIQAEHRLASLFGPPPPRGT